MLIFGQKSTQFCILPLEIWQHMYCQTMCILTKLHLAAFWAKITTMHYCKNMIWIQQKYPNQKSKMQNLDLTTYFIWNTILCNIIFHFWKELKEVLTSQPYLLYVRHYKPRLVYFYPIFHCGLYCRAVSTTDNLCT